MRIDLKDDAKGTLPPPVDKKKILNKKATRSVSIDIEQDNNVIENKVIVPSRTNSKNNLLRKKTMVVKKNPTNQDLSFREDS